VDRREAFRFASGEFLWNEFEIHIILWYSKTSTTDNGGGCPSSPDGGQLLLLSEVFGRREGCPMVTYEALFQYTLVIIGIITLIITVNKKK
jgi:hypothetical protein